MTTLYIAATAKDFKQISTMRFTIKNFQEHFPVGGYADVFLIDMVVQKHSARVLPRLFPEPHPEANRSRRIVFSKFFVFLN